MNIKGSRNEFLTGLQKVISATQSGNIHPILSNVLLKATGNNVELIAGDQETQIKAPCGVVANKKFDATVSAKKFQDILRRLDTDAEVAFDYQEKDEKKEDSAPLISISCGKARYKLSALNPDEFPLMGKKLKFESLLKLPASEMLRCLKRVVYSSAVNSHRLNLNGVLLEGSASGLRVVATDGHRMAVQPLSQGKSPGEVQLILPLKSVNELVRNLPAEGDSEIEILTTDAKSENQIVRFIAASFELTSTIITDSFPDYASVIPRNNDKTVGIVRKDLLDGLQRVGAVGDREPTVVMNLDKNKVFLECTNQDNDVGTDEVAVKYSGEKMEIGFNLEYLIEMLTAVEEDGFEIKILDASSSVLVVPTEKKKDFQYIIMPVRL